MKDVLLGALKRGVSAAVHALVFSALVLAALTLVAAVASYEIAGGSVDGVFAALVATAAGCVAIAYGAVKRAIGHGVRAALAHLAPGSRVIDGLLDRMGGKKLPLDQATANLDDVVEKEQREPVGGFFARRIRAVVLGIAESFLRLVFAKFARGHAGLVDFSSVRGSLGSHADDMLLAPVDGFIRSATAIAIAILAAGVVPAVLIHYQ